MNSQEPKQLTHHELNGWQVAVVSSAPENAPAIFGTGSVLVYRSKISDQPVQKSDDYWEFLKSVSNAQPKLDIAWVNDLDDAKRLTHPDNLYVGSSFFRTDAADEVRYQGSMAQIAVLGAISTQELWMRPVSWNGWNQALVVKGNEIIKVPSPRGGDPFRMLTPSEIHEQWELISPAIVLEEHE